MTSEQPPKGQEAPILPEGQIPEESKVFQRDAVAAQMQSEAIQAQVQEDQTKLVEMRGGIVEVESMQPQEVLDPVKLSQELMALKQQQQELEARLAQTTDANEKGLINAKLMENRRSRQGIEANMPQARKDAQESAVAQFTNPETMAQDEKEYEGLLARQKELISLGSNMTSDDKIELEALNGRVAEVRAIRQQSEQLIKQKEQPSTAPPKQSAWNKIMGWLGRK